MEDQYTHEINKGWKENSILHRSDKQYTVIASTLRTVKGTHFFQRQYGKIFFLNNGKNKYLIAYDVLNDNAEKTKRIGRFRSFLPAADQFTAGLASSFLRMRQKSPRQVTTDLPV